MIHTAEVKRHILLLEEQIGKPTVSNMPQNVNQSFIYVLKQLTSAVEQLEERLKIIESLSNQEQVS